MYGAYKEGGCDIDAGSRVQDVCVQQTFLRA